MTSRSLAYVNFNLIIYFLISENNLTFLNKCKEGSGSDIK